MPLNIIVTIWFTLSSTPFASYTFSSLLKRRCLRPLYNYNKIACDSHATFTM